MFSSVACLYMNVCWVFVLCLWLSVCICTYSVSLSVGVCSGTAFHSVVYLHLVASIHSPGYPLPPPFVSISSFPMGLGWVAIFFKFVGIACGIVCLR